MKFKHLLPFGCLAVAGGLTSAAQEAAPVNVLLNKSIVEVAGNPAADSEGPEKLIDGDLNTKYCIIQPSPYVVIDAQGYFNFTGFKFHDCQTNENEENAKAYTLKLSKDGKIWETVAEADNVADVALKEITLEAPFKARFVRFEPKYNNCARMWELEGFGTDATTLAAELRTQSLELNTGDEAIIEVAFTLTGEKAEDFACVATCEKSNVEVGTATEADGVFSIPVKGVSKGSAKVLVAVTNGGEVANFEIPVKVNSNEPISTEDVVAVANWGEDFVAEVAGSNGYTKGFQPSSWYPDNYVFYSAAVAEEGALCDEEGIIEVPTSGNVYKIPVEQNNALRVERNSAPVNLEPVEPFATQNVNLLVFAANKDLTLTSIIKYDDDSESDPEVSEIGAWQYDVPTGDEAITGLGVLKYDVYDEEKPYNVLENKDYRVYEVTIPANEYKNVKSIELKAEGGSYGNAVFVIGVNAHNLNGQVVKHLNASLAEESVKLKAGETADITVNYTLTDIEGLTDEFKFSASASKDAVAVGEIVNDAEAHTLTIPVTGVTPALAEVNVSVSFGEQVIDLIAKVHVKSTVVADTENCIEISNWRHDVIAENQPAANYSNTPLDEQGWVFFTDEIHPEGAIAGDERIIVAKSGNVYQLAPYDGFNGTVIYGNDSFVMKDDVEFANPIYTEEVNLLTISANGIANLKIDVNYEDGTTEPSQTALVADWYSRTEEGTEAVYGLGRLHRTNDDIAGERYFRLFEIPVQTKRESRVKSVTIQNRGNGTYLTVIGVNAKDQKESGIEAVEQADGGKTVEAYYNLFGQQVEEPAEGIYVVRYTDGTCAKVVIK